MSRCKACDSVLSEREIFWRADVEQWEDLCLVCREIVYKDGGLHDDISALELDGCGVAGAHRTRNEQRASLQDGAG